MRGISYIHITGQPSPPFPKPFHHPKLNLCTHEATTPPTSLSTSVLPSVSTNVSVPDTPSKCSHTVFVLPRLASVMQRRVFKVAGPFWPGLQLWSERLGPSPWIAPAFLHLGPVPRLAFVLSLGDAGDGGGQASASPAHIVKSQPMDRTGHRGNFGSKAQSPGGRSKRRPENR